MNIKSKIQQFFFSGKYAIHIIFILIVANIVLLYTLNLRSRATISNYTEINNIGFNFMPANITIEQGGTVRFNNSSDDYIQVDSDPHPQHTDYTPLNLELIGPGESKNFIANDVGSFHYHDHLHPSAVGTIMVIAKQDPTPTPSPSTSPSPVPTPSIKPTPTSSPLPSSSPVNSPSPNNYIAASGSPSPSSLSNNVVLPSTTPSPSATPTNNTIPPLIVNTDSSASPITTDGPIDQGTKDNTFEKNNGVKKQDPLDTITNILFGILVALVFIYGVLHIIKQGRKPKNDTPPLVQ